MEPMYQVYHHYTQLLLHLQSILSTAIAFFIASCSNDNFVSIHKLENESILHIMMTTCTPITDVIQLIISYLFLLFWKNLNFTIVRGISSTFCHGITMYIPLRNNHWFPAYLLILSIAQDSFCIVLLC